MHIPYLREGKVHSKKTNPGPLCNYHSPAARFLLNSFERGRMSPKLSTVLVSMQLFYFLASTPYMSIFCHRNVLNTLSNYFVLRPDLPLLLVSIYSPLVKNGFFVYPWSFIDVFWNQNFFVRRWFFSGCLDGIDSKKLGSLTFAMPIDGRHVLVIFYSNYMVSRRKCSYCKLGYMFMVSHSIHIRIHILWRPYSTFRRLNCIMFHGFVFSTASDTNNMFTPH